MRVLTFLNSLGLGGTEKAACRWSRGLRAHGHEVVVITIKDGPRRKELEEAGIGVRLETGGAAGLARQLDELNPDVIHAHAPGFPHEGDVLGEALSRLGRKIPVVQTNIFGRLDNPREDAWTDFRLFISWTSCVQAARRAFLPLDESFFQDKGVAVYPVDPVSEFRLQELRGEADRLRERLGIAPDEVLFGRFSRPEPNKWTDLPLQGFLAAARSQGRIRLLLREPPPRIARRISAGEFGGRVLMLPATSDAEELQISQMACDAVLHGSSIGESFGYGLAEVMVLGKPAIANSVPWGDQAQIELVRHGECGFIASTVSSTARAILRLAGDSRVRKTMGEKARAHVTRLADPVESLAQLEEAFERVTARVSGREKEAFLQASRVMEYLDCHQFGHDAGEWIALMPFYWRVRFHHWRRRFSSAALAGPGCGP
jgi:glycosyltransferase involved in cell wall biosynthesis